MKTVGSYEAKTHLPRLLEEVRRGEQVIITRHGVPIARLMPVAGLDARPVAKVVEEMRRLRRGNVLGGDSIAEMKAQGRR